MWLNRVRPDSTPPIVFLSLCHHRKLFSINNSLTSVLCVAASVGLALLLAEGSRSNPSWAPQVQTSKPTRHQRDCIGPTEIPSTQTTPVGQGPGNRHFLFQRLNLSVLIAKEKWLLNFYWHILNFYSGPDSSHLHIMKCKNNDLDTDVVCCSCC